MLWKIIVFIAIGAVLGRYMGKGVLDAISDLSKRKIRLSIACIAAVLVALLCGVIFWRDFRWACLAALLVLLVCAIVSFRYYIEYNTRFGIRTAWNDAVGKIVPDLVYDEAKPENRYDLYLPAEQSTDGRYGLAVYIHGGGFTEGKRTDGDGWCKYTTAKGYVSLTMDYTLAGKDSHSNLPQMVDEILACVTAAKEKCAALGYPLSEMTISGGSAGGCLAALYAFGKAEQSPIPVKFVFSESGPMYFDPIWWGSLNNPKGQADFVSMMVGQTVTEDMVKNGAHIPLFESISPACLVREGSVPMLCAYGATDKVVPPQLKYRLFEALERHHVPYTDVEYPRSGHMLYGDRKTQKVFLNKLDEYFEAYFEHKPKNKEQKK